MKKYANGTNTQRVIAFCMTFNCATESPDDAPSRFAGTIMQYSKNATPQLISTMSGSALPAVAFGFKCQYQAKVMKMFPAHINARVRGSL